MKIKTVILCLLFFVSCFLLSANAESSTDSRFKLAMKTVLRHEGGFSNDKNDPGGVTNYGISLRYLKSANIDVDGDGDTDKDDIIHLTLTKADDIYYKQWFQKYHYGDIKDQAVMTDILDFSINAGARQCHKVVQRAINSISSQKLEVDGILGKKSFAMINSLNPKALHQAINMHQKEFYRSIVKRNKSLSVFLKGWLRRADE